MGGEAATALFGGCAPNFSVSNASILRFRIHPQAQGGLPPRNRAAVVIAATKLAPTVLLAPAVSTEGTGMRSQRPRLWRVTCSTITTSTTLRGTGEAGVCMLMVV